MTEDRFNKIFSAFILIGMSVCVILSCLGKMQDPDARRPLLIITAFGALMGVASTVLSANGSIWTFLFGLIDVVIYSIILYDSKMPSQLLLHVLYFLPMEIIGFFQWRKRGASSSTKVKAQRLKGIKWLWYCLLFVGVYAASFALSYFISDKRDVVDLPKTLLDALVTTCNIVALVMMAFAYLEQWYVWTMVNVSSVILWTVTLLTNPGADYAVIPLIKYSFYFINGINGIRIWLKLSREETDCNSCEIQ